MGGSQKREVRRQKLGTPPGLDELDENRDELVGLIQDVSKLFGWHEALGPDEFDPVKRLVEFTKAFARF